ncbi:SRPBCC family protein [Streptomyces sp. NPDC046924]|uniref:SRPBCC family protein n=1 Tax=Streptomyces sp. NPDC046924 TaxID=3155136 RepID=UPI0033E89DBE
MSRAYFSEVLPAPVDTVWAVLGRFEDIADFVGKLSGGELEGDAGPVVGSVRRLVLRDGGRVVRERLVAMDADDRSYSYDFPPGENPFPVRGYRATIRVRPVTRTNETFVEWYGDFDSDAGVEADMREAFVSRYSTFLENLRDHLGLPSGPASAELSSGRAPVR